MKNIELTKSETKVNFRKVGGGFRKLTAVQYTSGVQQKWLQKSKKGGLLYYKCGLFLDLGQYKKWYIWTFQDSELQEFLFQAFFWNPSYISGKSNILLSLFMFKIL